MRNDIKTSGVALRGALSSPSITGAPELSDAEVRELAYRVEARANSILMLTWPFVLLGNFPPKP